MSNPPHADRLVALMSRQAVRVVEELEWITEALENADEKRQRLLEILAFQVLVGTVDHLLVLGGKHGMRRLKIPLLCLERRLLASVGTTGAPGLSLKEQWLRWWAVAAARVLVDTKAMTVNEARQYVAKHLEKTGIKRKRKSDKPITAATIKGWEKVARSATEAWPTVSPEEGRAFAKHVLTVFIPAHFGGGE